MIYSTLQPPSKSLSTRQIFYWISRQLQLGKKSFKSIQIQIQEEDDLDLKNDPEFRREEIQVTRSRRDLQLRQVAHPNILRLIDEQFILKGTINDPMNSKQRFMVANMEI